jgi:protein-S-isoprenylcysteine O-methyltransferase Ste14
MDKYQAVFFTAATILIIIFSWFISIRRGRYHGIARFFAFESITLLAVMAAKYWFLAPFSPLQTASWIFLLFSIYTAVTGFLLLVSMGRPKRLVEFEETTKLVTNGMYKYIRHPLYCSLVLLGAGIFLKHISTASLILVIINTLALYITARMEESEMIKGFGNEYRKYMKVSKMFIPFIF